MAPGARETERAGGSSSSSSSVAVVVYMERMRPVWPMRFERRPVGAGETDEPL
jgi:hypothetical protein